MVELILFMKGMLAGFVLAVPIGAIGAMCLRRALAGRWADGLVTGLGAALADTLLAAAAMFGLSLVMSYLLENKGPLRLIGGVFLIAIGVHMVRARHPHLTVSDEPQSFGPEKWRVWLQDFATGFGLTIINPATLVGFAGVFAGLGLFAARLNVLLANYVIVLGVFVGSALWWTTLTSAASTMRHHLPVKTLPVVNLVLGILVVGCGVLALMSGFGMIPWLPHGLNGQ